MGKAKTNKQAAKHEPYKKGGKPSPAKAKPQTQRGGKGQQKSEGKRKMAAKSKQPAKKPKKDSSDEEEEEEEMDSDVLDEEDSDIVEDIEDEEDEEDVMDHDLVHEDTEEDEDQVEDEDEEESSKESSKESKSATEDSEHKVVIANMTYDTDEKAIRKFFKSCGNIASVSLATNKDGSSKGLAFIQFADASSVVKAIKLHDKDLNGRNISVRLYEDKRKATRPKTNILFLGSLSFSTTEDSLRQALQNEGLPEPTRVSIPVHEDSGKPKGIAYVDFETTDEAERVFEATLEIDGRKIRMDYATPKSESTGSSGSRGFGGRGRGGFGGRGGGRGRGRGRGRGGFRGRKN